MTPRLIVILALAASPAAHALTGNDLHRMMQDDRDTDSKLAAVMYVAGLSDGISYGQFVADEMKVKLRAPAVCMPKNSQVGQAYDVIKDYLATHPQQRHLDAGALATYALLNVWPCR